MPTIPLTPYWSSFFSCASLVVLLSVLILALALSTAKRGPEDGE